MKQIVSLLFLVFVLNLCNSQNLNLKLLEQISDISPVDINNVMVNGYGFKKMKEENGTITYLNLLNENVDTAILIKISTTRDTDNLLDIRIGKNFSIKTFIDDLILDEFLFEGINKDGLYVYKKYNIYYLISKTPNKAGAYQILRIYNES